MELTIHQTNKVAAGVAPKNVFEAISIAVQIYEEVSVIIDRLHSTNRATDIYAKIGVELSEYIFNLTHPKPPENNLLS